MYVKKIRKTEIDSEINFKIGEMNNLNILYVVKPKFTINN